MAPSATGLLTYLPANEPIPSLASRATFALATGIVGYLTYRVLTTPNPNPEWSPSAPSSSSSPSTQTTPARRERDKTSNSNGSHQDLIGAPITLLAISLVRGGMFYLIGLHALISLSLSSSTPSSSSSSSSHLPFRHIPPLPPPAGYPRLNATLFTWNAVSAGVYALLATACWARLYVFSALGKDFTFRLRRPSRLMTDGVYAWCQHPSYTTGFIAFEAAMLWFARSDGVFGAALAPALFSSNVLTEWAGVWNTAVLPTVFVMGALVLWGRVKAEEEMLRLAFGREWELWHMNTARFIPFMV